MSEERQLNLTKLFVKEFQENELKNRALEAELRALKDRPQPNTFPAELREELERLKKVLGDCKDLAACTAAAANLREERDKHQSKNDTLSTEVASLKRTCKTLRRQNRNLKAEIDAPQNKSDDLEPLVEPDVTDQLEEYKRLYHETLVELGVAREEQDRLRSRLFKCEKKLSGE